MLKFLRDPAFHAIVGILGLAVAVIALYMPSSDQESISSTNEAQKIEKPSSTETPLSEIPPIAEVISKKQYPCDGRIFGIRGTGLLGQVKSLPNVTAPSRNPVEKGANVRILRSVSDLGKDWYQIEYQSYSGWIFQHHVRLLDNCPMS